LENDGITPEQTGKKERIVNTVVRDPYLSVIIPAYNEEQVITDHVTEVAEYLYRYLGRSRDFEIIIVDDGSTDQTEEVLRRLAVERPYLKVFHHSGNYGRGRALRTGFEEATGEFIVTLDADLSYSPDHIAKLLAPLERNDADIVLASAYHPEGSVVDVPWKRALISRMGNWLLSRSLSDHNLNTLTCVVRSYKKEVVETLELFSDDKDIHLEIINKARMLGFRIAEIPAQLKWRPGKRTTAKKGLSLKAFLGMASRHLFFNFLFRPSLLSMMPILLLGLIVLVLSVTLVRGYVYFLTLTEAAMGWARYYHALRMHIQEAAISYSAWGLCLLLLFQFVSLVFIAKQNNYHYRELFCTLSRISKSLKEFERKK
jgi:glycosyltransferase involved in cell wall biosynthesis